MRLLLRIVVPVVVLTVSALVVVWLISTRPVAELRQPPSSVQVVEVMLLTRTNYPVVLKSQGTVRPRTESTLKPEVSGRIVGVSPSFREGGFFEEDEVLSRVDRADLGSRRGADLDTGQPVPEPGLLEVRPDGLQAPRGLGVSRPAVVLEERVVVCEECHLTA